MTPQSVAAYSWICHQRVATVDTGHQDTGEYTEVKQIVTGKKTQEEGNQEGKETKLDSVTPVMLHTAHIQLQSRQEHDVVDTHLSEQLKGTVPVQYVQPVLSNQHTGQDKTYHMWNT